MLIISLRIFSSLISKSFNVDAKIVGRVESSPSKKLTITSEFGVFEY